MIELRNPFFAKCIKGIGVGTELGKNYLIQFIDYQGDNILYFYFNENNVLGMAVSNYFYKMDKGTINGAFYRTGGSGGQTLSYLPERYRKEQEREEKEKAKAAQAKWEAMSDKERFTHEMNVQESSPTKSREEIAISRLGKPKVEPDGPLEEKVKSKTKSKTKSKKG